MKRTFIQEPNTPDEFFKRRSKHPAVYTFTPEGDAWFRPPAESKLSEKKIPLPSYRYRTTDEVDALVKEKQERVAALYEEFEGAIEELHDAYYQNDVEKTADTFANIFAANQRLQTIDSQIATERNPQRWIETLPRPSKEEIEIKKQPIDRKLEFDVQLLHRSALANQDYYALRVEGEEETIVQTQAGGATAEQILNEDGILGLYWPSDLEVKKTVYTSPFQAVFGETAKANGNEELYEALLGTRSERTIRSLTTPILMELDLALLESVVRAAAEQIPDFKKALLETGDRTLQFQSKVDSLFATDNLWGKALMNVRTALREAGAADAAGGAQQDGTLRTVISLDEQRKAKAGAIITQRKVARAVRPIAH